MSANRYASFVVCVCLSASGMALADHGDDDDHGGGPKGNGGNPPVVQATGGSGAFFEAPLLAAGAVNTAVNTPSNQQFGPLLFPSGSDPLTSGRIRLSPDRSLTVSLRGALAGTTYTVSFCGLGLAPPCLAIPGQLGTDALGNADANLRFPDAAAGTPDNWAGSFLIVRSVPAQQAGQAPVITYEFASGFQFPAAAVPGQQMGEIDLRCAVTMVDPLGATFNLDCSAMRVVTNAATQFDDIASVASLRIGDVVRVKGVVQTFGTATAIVASSIKLDD